MTVRQKKQAKEDGEHEVNITITIAKGSPTVERDPDPKKNETLQVQNYFHCQYKLLPDDKDFIRTDVVTFGDAAKLYADNDSKVLRAWLQGQNTWVAWTNSRRVRVTHDTLLKMFKHRCELKFWDTKDKVSAKARFDRPKAFRLPNSKAADEVDLDMIRNLLWLEGKTNRYLGAGIISESTIEAESSTAKSTKGMKVDFTDSSTQVLVPPSLSVESSQFVSTADSKLEVKVRLGKDKQPEFKNLILLASEGANAFSVDTVEEEVFTPLPGSERRSNRKSDPVKSSRRRNREENDDSYKSLMAKDYVSEAEKIQQNGLASVSIPLLQMFTNCKSISNNLKQAVGSVQDVIIILTLDKPLLSEIQRDYLNPMALTIGSATQMPENGMNFKTLKTKCTPPYAKYKFHDSSEYITEQKEHGDELRFNEKNVMLLGTMSSELLKEFLLGPPLKVEVHDRDPKESLKKKAGIFGSREDDEEISNVTFTTSRINTGGYDKCFNISYGVAEFDLSELLKGERILTLVSPIRNCTKTSYESKKNDELTAKSRGFGIPAGDYLENGSEIKIKVELARSLTKKPPPLVKRRMSTFNYDEIRNQSFSEGVECPFNRMVYIFDYKNKAFLKEIITEINDINAEALDLLSYPPHVIGAALSTYKLTDTQKKDKTLDIVTGCQIIDGMYHMFLLEGISDQGIKRIWDKLEHPQYNEDSFFRLLYNSAMSFSLRIYISLDVDLTRVRLHQPLVNIVKQPLLYVRDIVPNDCFQAVIKLDQLTQCTSLHNAIRNEMLPSAEMIVSLAKEFGVPLTDNDCHDKEMFSNEQDEDIEDGALEMKRVSRHKKEKVHSISADMNNEMYDRVLEERRKSEIQKDYISSNIKSLLSISRARRPVVSCDTIEVAHNYSTQSLNSMEMAKEKLRQILAKDPDSRYTYCKDYNSATVVPVSVDKIAKEKRQLSKDAWKTKNGFVFPGFKSSLESNVHPKIIDSARKHELYMPWRENILHRNIVKPCVDRLLFKWEDRDLNFNTWTSPPEFFGKPAPVTIHAAGNTLENEKLLAKTMDEKEWQEKLVVDDDKFHTYRCLLATESTDKGPKSSNQQDRLHDILKDDPQKLPFKKPGMHLSPIPALSVVSYPNVDKYRRMTGQLCREDLEDDNTCENNVGFHPGEMDGVSWSRDVNKISIKDYEHGRFERTKGHDFRLVHTDREKVSLKIQPLHSTEKENHLFLVK